LETTTTVSNLNFDCLNHELAKRFEAIPEHHTSTVDSDPWHQYEVYIATRALKRDLEHKWADKLASKGPKEKEQRRKSIRESLVGVDQ